MTFEKMPMMTSIRFNDMHDEDKTPMMKNNENEIRFSDDKKTGKKKVVMKPMTDAAKKYTKQQQRTAKAEQKEAAMKPMTAAAKK